MLRAQICFEKFRELANFSVIKFTVEHESRSARAMKQYPCPF